MAKEKLSVEVSKDDHIQGEKNAPVTLVEYGDYECPVCGAAYPIVKDIQKKLGVNLRFVFRNFPLSEMHPHAAQAAEAAEAASAQGKFWEMHDALYENQGNLSERDLLDYSEKIGLDENQFATDLQNETYADKIQTDFESGVESGVNGTPTFFVNGVRFDGDWQNGELLDALQQSR